MPALGQRAGREQLTVSRRGPLARRRLGERANTFLVVVVAEARLTAETGGGDEN